MKEPWLTSGFLLLCSALSGITFEILASKKIKLTDDRLWERCPFIHFQVEQVLAILFLYLFLLPLSLVKIVVVVPLRTGSPLLTSYISVPGGWDGNESACNLGRHGFDPWVRIIPWRKEWLSNLILLPGEFHGQTSYINDHICYEAGSVLPGPHTMSHLILTAVLWGRFPYAHFTDERKRLAQDTRVNRKQWGPGLEPITQTEGPWTHPRSCLQDSYLQAANRERQKQRERETE